jgi:hypothetical protein
MCNKRVPHAQNKSEALLGDLPPEISQATRHCSRTIMHLQPKSQFDFISIEYNVFHMRATHPSERPSSKRRTKWDKSQLDISTTVVCKNFALWPNAFHVIFSLFRDLREFLGFGG